MYRIYSALIEIVKLFLCSIFLPFGQEASLALKSSVNSDLSLCPMLTLLFFPLKFLQRMIIIFHPRCLFPRF